MFCIPDFKGSCAGKQIVATLSSCLDGRRLADVTAIDEALMLTKPTVAMRLVSDDEAANPTRPGRFTAITLRLEEAL